MKEPAYPAPHLLDGPRWAGLRVGLLGGSFNPPHTGHLHASLTALRMLKLDFIWWLVTPQNPFKVADETPPLAERVALCRNFTPHPQILVSDLEKDINATRSIDTLLALRKFFPQTDFAWITGMDIAHEFHRWHRWHDILKQIATVHIARPPFQSLVQDCPLRLTGGTQNHQVLSRAAKASLQPGNSYWILDAKLVKTSSTEIRNNVINQ